MSEPPEHIAIIGMSGRFPKAANIEEYWDNLKHARECLTFFTEEELLAEGIRQDEVQHPAYVRARGIVEGIDLFDAEFFGFTPRDAEILDPQHRQFLECAWEALEDAGYDPGRAREVIGVYAGTSMSTYALRLYNNPSLAGIVNPVQILLANDKDHLATRVAYKLNLKGPAVTVGTACSTSLVTVCLAAQSLLDYQCDLVIAGGVTLGVPMRRGYLYQEGGMASPDGHCRPFDARAQGTVGGNGTAVVLLKRLSDALAHGDAIRAVIRGWGLNNDGAGKGSYTAPSMDGQSEVIAMALAMADIEPDTITMLESHGTATPLGDPIEFTALCHAWRKVTRRGFCALGSVKSNVGHMDSAAGAAGLIKCVLALQSHQIPATLHFERPNPKINLSESPFFMNKELRDWEPDCGVRRAAVSSFGFGGTNAHVILEEGPVLSSPGSSRPWQLLLLSARSERALEHATQRLADHLEQHADLDIADVAYTLQTGRSEFKCRRIVQASGTSSDSIVTWLRTKDPRRVSTAVFSGNFGGVTFLLPGQGAQHPKMLRGLYDAEPVYRDIIDRAVEILRPTLGLDVCDLLSGESSAEELCQTHNAQVAIFTLSYAIANLWMHWGIKPASLLGHSIGEYTAACLAGVMTFEDALWLVAERGRILASMPPGSMLAVALPEAQLRHRFGLDLAAMNGPSLSVLSGPTEDIHFAQQKLTNEGVPVQLLHTSHAFHSKLIEPAVPMLEQAVRRLRLQPPAIPYLSNVTGTWIRHEEAQSCEYWGRHLRATVRFSDCLQRIVRDSEAMLLETGPGQSLTTLARQHPELRAGRRVVASCRRAQDTVLSDHEAIVHALGRLWLSGASIDWHAFYRHETRRRVPLPTYPFERRRYWIDSPAVGTAPSTRPEDSEERQPLEHWFYVPCWVRRPSLTPPGRDLIHSWTILGDDTALKMALTKALADLEQKIDPNSGEASHILYCIADASIEAAYYRPLEFLQQQSHRQRDTAVVFIIGSAIEHAAVHGLAITAPQEHPRIRCRIIELDADAHRLAISGHAPHIVAEALESISNSRVAYKGAQRWSLLYEPAPLAAVPAHAAPRVEGPYLITGGVGRIGLVFAEFLARQGARTLILTSRDGSLGQQDLRWTRIRAIEALGTRVLLLRLADAADPDHVRDVVAQARSVAGRISGVFHAAGVTTESAFPPFAQIDRTVSEAHFQAKHRAALALSSAFADEPPDFFFMLSSISAALGGMGFGAYASANSLLDAVALRAPGPSRWMTANWDGWSLGPRSVGQKGSLISAEDGVEALHRILAATDIRQVIVSVRALGPRLEKIMNPPPAGDGVMSQVSGVHERPAISTEFVQPAPGLQHAIAAIWSNVLGVAQVGANDNFFELGGDSLLATQVVSRVKQTFQAEVPVRQLFEAPTVRQWAACVTQALQARSELEPVLQRSAHGRTAPVSFAQQRLWFLAKLVPDNPFYNIPEAVRLRGCLRRKILARVIQEIIRRHEALRTTFVEIDGRPMQTIGVAHIAVPLVDVSGLGGSQQEAEVARLVEQAVHACFDLARGPLLRVTLLQLAPQEHVCVVVMHHIISDSWSMRLFMNELVALYAASVREAPSRLEEVPVRYADFATWQRQWLTGSVLERHMAYWTRRLAPPLSPLELPLDYPRPEVFSYRGAREAIIVERTLTQALRQLSHTEGVTTFMAVLAAFLVMLQRYTQRDDLIVGTPIAGRDRREIEEVIGVFVNLLVLRTDVGGNPPFCDLLRRVRTVTLEAFEHQHIPFEKLIDHLKLKRDVGANPLIRVVLDVKMGTVGSTDCAGVVVSPYDFSIAYTKFDLALVLNEVDQELKGYVEYSTDLFKNTTIIKMIKHFNALLKSILENPAERIMALSLLDEQERAEIMERIYKERQNLSAEFSF